MRLFSSALLALASAVLPALVLSAESPQNHPLVMPFPESEITDYAQFEEANHLFALGSLQRSRGEVTPEDSVRLRGLVTQIVYSIPEGYEGAEVSEYFRKQFELQGAETLFQCSGRGCGSSNYWANDVFKRRVLYGPERNQYYLAVRAEAGLEDAPYIAVYVITRANRQLKVYVELVEPEQAGELPIEARLSAELLARLLDETGRVALPGIASGNAEDASLDSGIGGQSGATDQGQSADFAAVHLEPVLELLTAQPALRLYVVAHSGAQSDSLAEQLAASETRARALVEALVEEGVDEARLIPAGIGPLAPSCGVAVCPERFELVRVVE